MYGTVGPTVDIMVTDTPGDVSGYHTSHDLHKSTCHNNKKLYGSNHWLRAVVPTMQACNAVYGCLSELWFWEIPNDWVMLVQQNFAIPQVLDYHLRWIVIKSSHFFLFCTLYNTAVSKQLYSDKQENNSAVKQLHKDTNKHIIQLKLVVYMKPFKRYCYYYWKPLSCRIILRNT